MKNGCWSLIYARAKLHKKLYTVFTFYFKEYLTWRYSNTGAMTLNTLPSRDPTAYVQDI